jgi:hypothetical protein
MATDKFEEVFDVIQLLVFRLGVSLELIMRRASSVGELVEPLLFTSECLHFSSLVSVSFLPNAVRICKMQCMFALFYIKAMYARLPSSSRHLHALLVGLRSPWIRLL